MKPHTKRVATAKEHLAGIRAGQVLAQEMAQRHLDGLAVGGTSINNEESVTSVSESS